MDRSAQYWQNDRAPTVAYGEYASIEAMAEEQQRSAPSTVDLRESEVHAAEVRLADKLDRLSAPLAEQVLKRAIELHEAAATTTEDGSVSYDELARIGEELGIDSKTVQQALMEQLDAGEDGKKSWRERLWGPRKVTGGVVAEGDATAVEEQLIEWMREVENMYPTRQSGGTTTWEATGDGGRLAAAIGGVQKDRLTTRQTQLASGDQLVEMEVDTTLSQVPGWIFTALGLILGGGLGLVSAFEGSFAPDLFEFLLPTVGIAGVLGGLGAVIARSTTNRVRTQVNRALDGVVNLATVGRRGRYRKQDRVDDSEFREIGNQ